MKTRFTPLAPLYLFGWMLVSALTPVSLASDKEGAAKGEATNSTNARLHRPLPESLTSFGAAVQGEYLYVFSGHSGEAHGFGKDLLVDHFRRIRFDDPAAEWEELAMHEPAQSVALVSDDEYLYRIAGLSFLNGEGDSETNFNSTTHFARYDVKKNEWTALADLPAPRSSLDAAVLDRCVYVAGGWNLQGSSSRSAPWHEDILCFDLDNPEAGWKSLPGPGYKTRALSVAAHEGKLFVIGGMQERGISKKVSVYDPSTESWHEGPELPADSPMQGFATSSFAVGGQLYVTGNSGVVYRLGEQDWEVVQRLLFPRMFLRLLPVGEDRLIALGGTGSIGRTGVVESLSVNPEIAAGVNQANWSVEFGGKAKHSQALALRGGKLYAMGGNASWQAHDFSEKAFVDEAFVFDLGNKTAKALPNMPRALQGSAAVIHSQTSEHSSVLVAGGLGYGGGPKKNNLDYLNSVYSFDLESEEWTQSEQELPNPRAMFNATVHEEAIWMFAGSSGRDQGLAVSILHWWGDESAIAPLHKIEIPTPRRSFGGALLDNHYYLVGGLASGMKIAESVDVFDLTERTWSTIPGPSVPRVFPSLTNCAGKLYLHGGFTRADGHFMPAETLEVYDSESKQWSAIEGVTGIRSGMSMLNFNDRLLFFGVNEDAEGVADFVIVDPEPQATPEKSEGMSFGRSLGRRDDSKETAKMLLRKDGNKDGMLDREELGSRLADLVAKGDENNDEKLSATEILTALKEPEAEEAETEKRETKSADASDTAESADAKPAAKTTPKDSAKSISDLLQEIEKLAEQSKKAASEETQRSLVVVKSLQSASK